MELDDVAVDQHVVAVDLLAVELRGAPHAGVLEPVGELAVDGARPVEPIAAARQEEGGLQALVTPPKPASGRAARRWAGPYLQQATVDPWGNPLNYKPVEPGGEDAAGRSYRLWSNGPDGRDDDGGNDDILSGANRPTRPGS